MDVWSNQSSTEHLVMLTSEESSSQSSSQLLPLPSPTTTTGTLIKRESADTGTFSAPSSCPSSPSSHRHQHHSHHHVHNISSHHENSLIYVPTVPATTSPGTYGHGGGSVQSTSKSELMCNNRYPNASELFRVATAAAEPGLNQLLDYSENGSSNSHHPNFPRRISSYDSCSSPDSPDRHFCSSTTQSNGELNHPLPEEIAKEESDSPKRLCLVCGDTASGFHYGVASCEACKAFFKRTIQGNIEYTCPATNDCEINKRRRKACQACRFQKCLRMGMLKEGVRLDRVRGGRQKYRRSSETPYSMHNSIPPPKKPTLEENKILVALLANEPDVPTVSPECLRIHTEIRTLSILSDLYDKEIISAITWAKQVPGFTELTLNDQMRLLQCTWAEMLTLSLIFRSMSTPGRLTFATDFSLDEKQAKDGGVYDLYLPCLQAFERFERIGLVKEEYCLMKAIVLANADTRIDDYNSLKKLRENVVAALYDCSVTLKSTNAVSHTHTLLTCLPILRQVEQSIKKFWLSVRREGKVSLNKLFVEMLEAYYR